MDAGRRHEPPGQRQGEVITHSSGGSQSIIFLFLFFFINLFIIYLFIFGCVGSSLLHVRAFSSCGERELLFIVVRGLLTAVASFVVEHGL